MSNYFFDVIPKKDWGRFFYLPTVCRFMDYLNEYYSSRPAINEHGIATTYGQLYERVGRRRAFIQTLGLPVGAHIAVMDNNSQDAIELYLAIMTAGYVVVMLPTQLAGQELAANIEKFDIVLLFAGEKFEPICAKAGLHTSIISVHSISDTYFQCEPTVVKSTIAAIYFSVGTAGAPQGVMLSHGNIMRGSFNSIFRTDSTVYPQRYLTILPFNQITGSIFGMMGCLYTGIEIYTSEGVKDAVAQIPLVKPNMLVVEPDIIEILLGMARIYGKEFFGGELRTVCSSASKALVNMIQEMDQMGIIVTAGYGLPETSNLVTGIRDLLRHPTSVGKVYPEQEVKLVDGEIWTRGDNVFQGYYGDQQATVKCMEDGWFRTGDLGRFDEDGFLYITERQKNFILLLNGEKIAPETLEEPFYKYPYIKDCLVQEMVVDDVRVVGIQILPTKEVLESKSKKALSDLLRATVDEVNKHFPPYCHIMHLVIRDKDFVRNGSMKISRNSN